MWKSLARCSLGLAQRSFSTNAAHVGAIEKWLAQSSIRQDVGMKAARLDWAFILNEANLEAIESNTSTRKGLGDIRAVVRIENKISEYRWFFFCYGELFYLICSINCTNNLLK